MKKLIYAAIIISLSGCAQTTQINTSDGKKQFLIECGAGTAWSVCYEEANNACPSGYTDISKSSGFNRKEMTIECK
ncbi:hypothetical protein [Serratia marcescens]|uniref:hypothetical protein n=1 Tax=Serratia marcescens TaxID=615 RepID=UPI001F14DD48|nr:hypothetical protein [Serratia marcescens]